MSQQQVVDYLKQHPTRWFSCKEITEGINKSRECSKSLLLLRGEGCVRYKQVTNPCKSRGKTHKLFVYCYKK